MYQEYRGKGVEVVAYCGDKEPGTEKEFDEFQKEYGAKFPTMRADLNQDEGITYLRKYSSLNGGKLPGNFTKFLIDYNGDVVAFYPPNSKPQIIFKDIDQLLVDFAMQSRTLD